MQVFKDSNVENALKQQGGASLLVATPCGADWTAAFKGSDVERQLKVSVNPKPCLDNCHGLLQFTAYVGNLLRPLPLTSVLPTSDVIGNISFTRPVLYVFPGQHGDAALFGMKDFNMLVDGGFSRRSCFWDFVRHLDGIDALLMTHLGPDNLFGVRSLLERKAADAIHPDINCLFMNTGKPSNGVAATADLTINLAQEGGRLVELSRKLGLTPQPLTRPLSGNLEPVNLFHKVGKGSLDMYVLNPVGDAKEMKEFLSQWGKQAPSFGNAGGVPIPNCTSVCALLVVRPASPTEKVTRILFPGTAPQHKLLEGLERVKMLEFLKHPTFCTQDLQKPKKAASSAAASGNDRGGSASRKAPAAATSRPASAAKAEPPKRLEVKATAGRPSTAPSAGAKSSKPQKDSNKRPASARDKEKVKQDEKEKENKSKSSASSSPSKASVKTSSPAKTPSTPAKTPSTPGKTPTSPAKSPAKSPSTAAKSAAPTSTAAAGASQSVSEQTASTVSAEVNHVDKALTSPDLAAAAPADMQSGADNRMAQGPDAVQQPGSCQSNVDPSLQQAAGSVASQQQALRDLGIYDDDDEGLDDGFDDKENGGVSAGPEEEMVPQALPEPTAAAPNVEPDLLQDTFSKAPAMDQSQIFDQEIQPDYSGQAQQSSPDSQLSGTAVGQPDWEQGAKEESPALEEPTFADDAEVSENSNTIAQSIQYGMTHDNGYQMGGIREEEEEEEAAAQQEDLEQKGEVEKQSMEEMGIYDDEEEDETAEGADKDAYAYENDVNLEDEEIRMTGRAPQEQGLDREMFGGFAGDADQAGSNIPEAFEKDDSPTPLEKPGAAEEVDSGQEEDTDSIDGGTPDHDKDVDELLASRDPGKDETDGQGQSFNPFLGLGQQAGPGDVGPQGGNAQPFEEDELEGVEGRGGMAEFDPLSQWGPPTGLPAPLPRSDDTDMAAGVDTASDADTAEFDPLAEWGQPMGLPSPPPPEVNSKGGATKGGSGDAAKPDSKKPGASPSKAKTGAEKRPTSASKNPAKPANGTAEPARSARTKPDTKKASLDTSRAGRPASGKTLDTSRADPAKVRPNSSTTARKPATATKSRVSPDVIKMPPLPAFTPFYVDLTYIPNHGDTAYVDVEFFKRIRARYYVLSARNPNPKVLEQLLEAKATWDKGSEQEVTVIPTYETTILQHWMAVHKEKLAESKVEIAPAASRCTVRLQDHEDSCYTYRLEF